MYIMDANGKVGYAVVGLGIGMAHVAAVDSDDNARLVAVCDLKQEKLDEVAKSHPDTLTYTSFDEMLKNPDIDIISICLPSGMHAEYSIKAMEAGKNVLIEKPVDITSAAAEKIIETQKRTHLKAGVIHQNRFNLNMRPIKEAIDSGKLGKIYLGTFEVKWYRAQSYYDNGWHGTWSLDGGGSLINQAVHTVDIMQWLMGKPVSVFSKYGIFGHNIETEDMTASIFTFENGATATFVSTTCAYPGICTSVKIYGTNGSVEADSDKLSRWSFMDAPEDEEKNMLRKYGRGNGPLCAKDPSLRVGHSYQVSDIIECVRTGREPVIKPEDAICAVRIIEAVYRSAKTGEVVYL